MKKAINTLIICLVALISYSQIEIKQTIKPDNGICNGKVLLGFIESEIPGKLTITPTDQSNSGGLVTINSTSYILKDLCVGTYNLSFKDNHGCVTEEEIDLGACDLDIAYEVDRYDCSDNEKYNITLTNLPENQLYYEWSNGSTKSSLTRRNPGNYSVTVTSENGCSKELSMIIESTKVSIANIQDPSEEGYGCDGRASIQSLSENQTFTITLKVNSIIVYSQVLNLSSSDFEIPVDLCYYDDNRIEILDKYDCVQEFPVNLSFVNCSTLEVTVSELWNASNWGNWDNGYVKLKLTDPNIDPNDFIFSLYAIFEDETMPPLLISSGIGKTEFDNLNANCQKNDWKDCSFPDIGCPSFYEQLYEDDLSYWFCNYRVVITKTDNDLCKSMTNFTIRQCSNNPNFFQTELEGEVLLHIREDGEGYVRFSKEMFTINKESKNYSIVLTGPSGNQIYNYLEPHPTVKYYPPAANSYLSLYNSIETLPYQCVGGPIHCENSGLYVVVNFFVDEPGTYCLKLDDGCGNISTECVEVLNCPESMNFKDGPYYVYPSERDNSLLGYGYENIEKAFIASRDCEISSSYYATECTEALKYLDNAYLWSDYDHIVFDYTPSDPKYPCEGGTVKMNVFKEILGVDKVILEESFELTEPADLAFQWQNLGDPLLAQNLHKFRYAHLNTNFNQFSQICAEGNYCLYETSKIFSDFVTSKYMLFSYCDEVVDVCSLYPNSTTCGISSCNNGKKDGSETSVDCGGSCPPCGSNSGDDGNPCFFECDDDEDCINGECLQKCDDVDDCPFGYICNEDGYCIEPEGPCNNGVCPDGQICISGYCYEGDSDPPGECESPCQIIDIYQNPSIQSQPITVTICINSGDFPQLSVYQYDNMSGDLYYSEVYDYMEPGEHNLIIPAGSLPLGNCFISSENDDCTSDIKPHIVIAGFKDDDNNESRELKPNIDKSDIFLIYPNPNIGMFTIENLSNELIDVFYLYDINGKKISESEPNSNNLSGKFEIDLKNIVKGVYFLEIQTSSNRHFNKIIVQ